MSTIEPVEPLDPPLVKRAIAEAIGTFILVLFGCGSAVALTTSVPGEIGPLQFTGIALGFGLGIAAAIYAVGHISGAHLNPAVTAGLTAIGRFRPADVPFYVAAQFAGAIAAALVLWAMFPDARDEGGLGNNAVADGVGTGSALVAEVVLTAVFLFVIVAVATDERVTPGFAGLAIGFALAAIHLVAIPLTGTSVNPARTFGPDLVAWEWDDIWIFLIAPVVGGSLGALLYDVVRPDRVRAREIRPGRERNETVY